MTVYEAVSIVGQYSLIGIGVLTLVVTLIINNQKKN